MINENITAENITEYIKKAIRSRAVFGLSELSVKSEDFPAIEMNGRNILIQCALGVKAYFDFGNIEKMVFVSALSGEFELGTGSYVFTDDKNYTTLQVHNHGKLIVQMKNSAANIQIDSNGVFAAEVHENFDNGCRILIGNNDYELVPPEPIYLFVRDRNIVTFESYNLEYDINNQRRAEGVYVIHREYLKIGEGVVIEYPLEEYEELKKILGDRYILELDGRGIFAMLLHDGKDIEFMPIETFKRDAVTLYNRNAMNKIANKVIPWDMAEELEW